MMSFLGGRQDCSGKSLLLVVDRRGFTERQREITSEEGL